jgi:hypothetical protein
VPAMKLTFNAAMRARDVSRPRAEHLAAAEAAEAGGPRARASSAAAPAAPGRDKATPSRVAAGMDEKQGRAGFPRRRRGRPSR